MNKETADLLNRVTSSACVFLTMVLVVNVSMLFGSTLVAMLAGWLGVHLGMMYFTHINWWK